MKAHLAVDSGSKLIHAAVATPANVADSAVLPDLLHGRETRVWGDQAYRGQRAVIRQHAPKAQDVTNRLYFRGTIFRGYNPGLPELARPPLAKPSIAGCNSRAGARVLTVGTLTIVGEP